MSNEIKNLQFKVRPYTFDISTQIKDPHVISIGLAGEKLEVPLKMRLTQSEFNYFYGEDYDSLMNDEFLITIEKVIREKNPHELLSEAANQARSGNRRSAVDKIIQALQKMVETK